MVINENLKEKEKNGLSVKTRSMKYCGLEEELQSESTSPVSLNVSGTNKVDEILNDDLKSTELIELNKKRGRKKKDESKQVVSKKKTRNYHKKVYFFKK